MFRKSNHARRKRAHDQRAKRQAARKPEKRSKQGKMNLLGGLAAGVVGGIVATWVLDMYQQGALEATRRAEHAVGVGPVLSRRQEEQMRDQQRAHVDTAQRIAKSTIGKSLSRLQRRGAAPVVHYAIGALAGGAYGLAAEIFPVVRRGYGTGYSNLLFLGGSKGLLPGLNFGSRQKITSAVTAGGLSAPLIYGATLETTRRILRWFL